MFTWNNIEKSYHEVHEWYQMKALYEGKDQKPTIDEYLLKFKEFLEKGE